MILNWSDSNLQLVQNRAKILIPQMKNLEIVNHFQKEGYPRRTIYVSVSRLHRWRVNRRQTDPSTSWTSTRQKESAEFFSWSTNNSKWVSQRRLGRTLSYSHLTICRQISKIECDIPLISALENESPEKKIQGFKQVYAFCKK